MPNGVFGTPAFLSGLLAPGAWMATVGFLIFLVVLPLMVFSIPLVALYTHHRRKMEEMRMQRQSLLAKETQAEFAALREEIKALRDTTMQYDLSFDSALQGMEHRLTRLERTAYSSASEVHASQSVGAR